MAIGLSGLCLAHCLALPVLAGFLPVLGVWAEAEWVHWAFVALAVPVSLWALTRPDDGGGRTTPILLAVAGCGLLIAGAAGVPLGSLETPLTVGGGLALASAHGLNWHRRVHAADTSVFNGFRGGSRASERPPRSPD